MFWNEDKTEKERKETERRRKINASQLSLIEAATTTANVASEVTFQLKKHLEDSIRQIEMTMKIVNDALIICEESGIIKAINPASEKIFSCRSFDILSKNITILFDIPEENLWENLINLSFAKRQNNEIFSVEIKIEKMTKTDNSVLYLILVKDLTENNNIKKTSKEYEKRYRTLFEENVNGIIIIQNKIIVASNDVAKNILKQTKLEDLEIEPGDIVGLNDENGNIEFIVSGSNIIWNDTEADLITIKDIRGLDGLKTKFKNDKDMIICFDANFKITFVNNNFCSFYRKQKSDLIDKDIRDVLDQTELATLMVSINSLTEKNPTKKIQIHFEKKEQTIFQDWIDTAIYENGKIVEYQRTGKNL